MLSLSFFIDCFRLLLFPIEITFYFCTCFLFSILLQLPLSSFLLFNTDLLLVPIETAANMVKFKEENIKFTYLKINNFASKSVWVFVRISKATSNIGIERDGPDINIWPLLNILTSTTNAVYPVTGYLVNFSPCLIIMIWS